MRYLESYKKEVSQKQGLDIASKTAESEAEKGSLDSAIWRSLATDKTGDVEEAIGIL